jgi:hypothetical protein
MPTFHLRAAATVSCYTEVEADSIEEAIEIAENRELAGLCAYPFTGDISEEWYFESDGVPFDILGE